MAIVTTPLGFQKPDDGELFRDGNEVISANGAKSEELHQDARGRLVAIEAKNVTQDAAITAAENSAKTYTDTKTTASAPSPVLLLGTEDLLTLPNGRYRVSSGAVASTLGLPTGSASHGFLAVKRNTTAAALTWEAISTTDPSAWSRMQSAGAWSTAWGRTDGRGAVVEAKTYTDAQDAAYRTEDRALWRAEDDSHQAAAEANAATYTDGKDTTNRAAWAAADATKLAEAKTYADTQDAAYRTTDRALWRSEDDGHQAAAEAAAKTYTDGQVATDRGRLTAIESKNVTQDGRLDTVEGMQPVKAVKLESSKWVWGLAGATHFVIPDHTGALIVRATAQPVPASTPALDW